MALLANTRPRDEQEGQQALQSLVLKSWISSSGVLRSLAGPSGSFVADLFADVLADALAPALRFEAGTPPAPGALANAPQGVHPLGHPGVGRQTSDFGPRTDPLSGKEAFHRGEDWAAAEGTPFVAVAAGTVVFAGERAGYGRTVEVDHGDGSSSLYAHASALQVGVGERVTAGQPLGNVGQTGRATGPHLHFELRCEGTPVSPTAALKNYRRCADTEGGP